MAHSRKLLLAVLASVLLMLATGWPTATPAAAQSAISGSVIYLPLVSNGSTATGGTLANGGTYIGAGGVGLGALVSSLPSPISVIITNAPAPATSLPAKVKLLSAFYQISAGSTPELSPINPLILAVPVPSGANSANLAVALIKVNDGIKDIGAPIAAWTFLEGRYDPNKNLFLTTIASLDPIGETITLVEHPDFTSPTNAVQTNAHPNAGPVVNQFVVYCLNFVDPSDCTASTEITVESYLTDINNHIQGDLKFHDPRLRFLNESIQFNPGSWAAGGYTAYIEPYDQGFCASGPAAGYYDPTEGRLVLCLDPVVGLNPYAVTVLIHEFFHATQFGYPKVMTDRTNGKDENWLIEGTAKTVEESFFSTEMLRSVLGGWVNLHKVDVPLKSDQFYYEYFAQDFWVYAGQALGQGMSYLDAVLTQGAKATDVVNVLDFGTHLRIYWDYVKNQVMEPSIKQSGALGTACSIYLPVVNQLVNFNYDFYQHPYQILDPLDPLTSVVVEMHWDFNYTGADGAAMPTDPNDAEAGAALRFKLYKNGETGCEAVPDGRRTFMNVDKNARYFVVISNIDPVKAHNYLVGFEAWPIPP